MKTRNSKKRHDDKKKEIGQKQGSEIQNQSDRKHFVLDIHDVENNVESQIGGNNG